MVFVAVRKDVLLGRQECWGLESNLSTVLKCVDVTGSTPRVSRMKGRVWVANTRFGDVVLW